MSHKKQGARGAAPKEKSPPLHESDRIALCRSVGHAAARVIGRSTVFCGRVYGIAGMRPISQLRACAKRPLHTRATRCPRAWEAWRAQALQNHCAWEAWRAQALQNHCAWEAWRAQALQNHCAWEAWRAQAPKITLFVWSRPPPWPRPDKKEVFGGGEAAPTPHQSVHNQANVLSAGQVCQRQPERCVRCFRAERRRLSAPAA